MPQQSPVVNHVQVPYECTFCDSDCTDPVKLIVDMEALGKAVVEQFSEFQRRRPGYDYVYLDHRDRLHTLIRGDSVGWSHPEKGLVVIPSSNLNLYRLDIYALLDFIEQHSSNTASSFSSPSVGQTDVAEWIRNVEPQCSTLEDKN